MAREREGGGRGRREDREQYLLDPPDVYSEKYRGGYSPPLYTQELDPYDHHQTGSRRRNSLSSRGYVDQNRSQRRNSRHSNTSPTAYDGPGRSVRPGNKRLIIACDGSPHSIPPPYHHNQN